MSETRTENSTAALRQAEAAETEAAEAEALAATARARAQELRDRRSAVRAAAEEHAVEKPDTEEPAAEESDTILDGSDDVGDDEPLPRPSSALALKAAGVAAGVTALVALVACSGYFVWQDREVSRLHEQQTQYAAAAQQGVVNLMSLDFNNAEADIQRVVDGTTGEFHDDFASSTNDFLTVMRESQVVTTAAVSATAVDSMTADSAVVLVAATSQVANSVSKDPNPRIWRLSVTVNKVDDQIKMSKVEFVP